MKILINLLGSFVALNIKICRFLEQKFPSFFVESIDNYEARDKLIDDYINEKQPKTIIEVGGIDRPLIKKSKSYKYIGVDIEEKKECYEIYDEFYVQSIEEKLSFKGDLIISTEVIEHVQDNNLSFHSMLDALNESGSMIHYIPSKNHFYSIILRIVGPKLQKILIKYLRPHAVETTGYPAFFSHCSPSDMKKLCEKVGFSNIEIVPFYKATDYFAFFFPLFIIIAIFENIFEFFNLRFFASCFILKADKKIN
tara:strand:- start:530 stop:1288 length:759 start_codon:yes stop_codon:yes gene_type:complete